MAEEQQEVAPNASANGQAASPEDSEAKALKRKRLMIMIGAAIVTLIILGLVILSLVLTLGRTSCKSVEDAPSSHYETRPIPSQDNRALVRLDGYLEMTFENSRGDSYDIRYAELKLKKVHHSRRSDDILVNLITDCGTIGLRVYRDYTNARYALHDIYMQPNLSDHPFKECNAEVDDIYFGFKQYYSCDVSFSLTCLITNYESAMRSTGSQTPKLVRLKFYQLDLEIDGDPAAIESGYFNLEPKIC